MIDENWVKNTIEQAGEIAQRYFGKVTPSIKDNDSYVTQGDLEVQDYLVTQIQERYPDDGVIAEESNVSRDPVSGNRRWIIDPIDGTSSFVRGFPTWGIAVGIIEGDKPISGFFYMPRTSDFFYAGRSGAVIKNDQVMHARELPNQLKESVLLVDSKFHKMFSVNPGYKGKIRSLGSASAHMSYVATGSADAVILPALPIWDLAAGFAILKNTACTVMYFDGTPVSIEAIISAKKALKPVICGRKEMIQRVQDACVLK